VNNVMFRIVVEVAVEVIVLLVLVTLGLVTGSGSREEPGVRVVGYGRKARATSLLTVGFVVLIFITHATDRRQIEGPMWAVIGGIVLLGGLLGVETFGTRVTLTADGLEKRSLYGGRTWIAWADVERVYINQLQEVVVRGNGRKLSVLNPTTTDRYLWFVEACRTHLPPDKYPEAFRRAQAG
jgi:hypothetical protein